MANRFKTIILLFSFGLISLAYGQNTMVLDSSFAQDGLLVCHAASVNESIYSMVVQSDGKIIATGATMLTSSINGLNNYDICTMRFNPDGSTDSTFGINGRAITDIAGNQDIPNEIILQPDGKILITAEVQDSAYNTRVCCIRYHANGLLDTTFGDNGISMPFYMNITSISKTVIIQPDGKIILSGLAEFVPGYSDFFCIRIQTDGSIDLSFGTLGIFRHNINNSSCVITKSLIQPDGKIVLGGYYTDSINYNMPTLIRLTTSGILDNTFGTGGITTTDVGNGRLTDIKIDYANRIISIGNTYSTVNPIYVAKYNSNGSMDNSFGTLGIEYSFVECNSLMMSLILRSGNKYLLGGIAYDCPPVQIQFAMAQFNNSGVLDTTFDFDGKYTHQQLSAIGRTLTTDTYGAVYFGGELYGSTYDYMIIKLKGKGNFISVENEQDGSFNIYPNPVESSFIIETPTQNQHSYLEVLDVAGRTIKRVDINSNKQVIDISALPIAVYLIKVYTSNGYSTQKLVKQ